MTFSHANLRTVADFAARLGLPARAAQDGSFSFVFARTGTLSVTPTQDGRHVYVSLTRTTRRADATLVRQALRRSGFDPSTNRLIRVGLAPDDGIHLAIDFAEPEFDLPNLDAGLQQLADLFDSLG